MSNCNSDQIKYPETIAEGQDRHQGIAHKTFTVNAAFKAQEEHQQILDRIDLLAGTLNSILNQLERIEQRINQQSGFYGTNITNIAEG